MAEMNTVQEITAKIETGVKELFESDTYKDYLRTMSRFHRYSARNIMLIHLQRPDSTHVAGYQAWTKKFNRQVRRGEKSIKILAPATFTIKQETEVIDPVTKKPIIGENGAPLHEVIEIKTARFKVANVFDVSQTVGEPLPTLAETLIGDVERYDLFLDTLKAVSPYPIEFATMPDDTDGLCNFTDKKISIREGMSQIQTVSAIIHEIAHAKLHDIETLRLADADVKPKDRRTEEVEAESVAYSILQYHGVETGANSFGYLATWSKDRDLKELTASLEIIRITTAELIDSIDEKYKELAKERGIDLSKEVNANNISTEQNNTVKSIEHQLHEKLSEMFPDLMSGKYNEANLEAEGLNALSIEWLSQYSILVMHTYEKNGEVYYDPKIVFDVGYEKFDGNEVKTLTAVEFEQSNPYLYQLYDADGRWLCYDEESNESAVFGLQHEINGFALQWFDKITEQGYMPVAEVSNINSVVDLELLSSNQKDIPLPDPSVTIEQMNNYGYINDSMYPLLDKRAAELFHSDENIYLLHKDNTEDLAFDLGEIESHAGLFGIEHTDWENRLGLEDAITEVNNSESSRETILIFGKVNQFGIYQISDKSAQARDYRFENMERLNYRGLTVDRVNYELVYTAPLTTHDQMVSCNILWSQFQGENPDRPSDYKARSVSVSDVFVLQQNGEVSAYFVDSYGFIPVPNFTGHEKQSVTLIQDSTQSLDKSAAELNKQAPTVADLKADVDEGKSISLSDLARAVQAEGNPSVAKSKPSLLGKLKQNKQRVAMQTNSQKQNESEVTK